MNILVACEFSGVVRDAFRRRGHEAFSCDLLPSNSKYHFQVDVRRLLDLNWDLIVAHPDCTNLTNAGVRWLYERDGRWNDLEDSAAFFRLFLDVNCSKVAIENPIPHKYALRLIGRRYDQIIHPWQFGHGETKQTCLWLKGLPPLHPTCVVSGRRARVHRESSHVVGGLTRSQRRSVTYAGIAEAMAEQWAKQLK